MAEGVGSLRKQAAKILAGLEKEIAKKERELDELRKEADICKQVVGNQTAKASARAPAKASAKASAKAPARKRLNWTQVLAGLPDQFTAKDVVAQIKKSPAAVYTQLYQMTKTGRLKRTKDGYAKV